MLRMTGITLIKFYGERNTGTNYVRRLLELNFQAPVQPGMVGRRIGRPIESFGAAVGLVSPRLAPALYDAMNAQVDHDIAEACGYRLTNPTHA